MAQNYDPWTRRVSFTPQYTFWVFTNIDYHFCWAELTFLIMTAARKGLYLWFQSFTFAPAQQTQKHLLLQALALEEGNQPPVKQIQAW